MPKLLRNAISVWLSSSASSKNMTRPISAIGTGRPTTAARDPAKVLRKFSPRSVSARGPLARHQTCVCMSISSFGRMAGSRSAICCTASRSTNEPGEGCAMAARSPSNAAPAAPAASDSTPRLLNSAVSLSRSCDFILPPPRVRDVSKPGSRLAIYNAVAGNSGSPIFAAPFELRPSSGTAAGIETLTSAPDAI